MSVPNNVRKCATHGLVLTGSRFFCDAEFDDCEPVRVHVFTDAELQARDERIIRAAVYSAIPEDRRAPIAAEWIDSIIEMAGGDQ